MTREAFRAKHVSFRGWAMGFIYATLLAILGTLLLVVNVSCVRRSPHHYLDAAWFGVNMEEGRELYEGTLPPARPEPDPQP